MLELTTRRVRESGQTRNPTYMSTDPIGAPLQRRSPGVIMLRMLERHLARGEEIPEFRALALECAPPLPPPES